MNIINTHDQLRVAVSAGIIPREQAVALCYSPPISRQCRSAQTCVYSPFFKTHPEPTEAHWAHDGNMVFIGSRPESMEKAKKWAEETYGIKEWKGNRMRDQVPAIVQIKFPIPSYE